MGGRMFYILYIFADLKATYDNSDTRKLGKWWEGIKDQLRRIIKIYKEMKNMIKTENEKSEEFWIGYGMRPLYDLYII